MEGRIADAQAWTWRAGLLVPRPHTDAGISAFGTAYDYRVVVGRCSWQCGSLAWPLGYGNVSMHDCKVTFFHQGCP